jgi:hypothetical protein
MPTRIKTRGAMSFLLTTPQFIDGSKDVTRRLNWLKLKVGDVLIACEKCMGLKRGEKRNVLGLIEIVSVRREPLNAITTDDCRREGFPRFRPSQFVSMFCQHHKDCTPETLVTRIEFKRLPYTCETCGAECDADDVVTCPACEVDADYD